MSKELSAKTCTIERMIREERAVEAALAGRKRAVRRNGRYADPGEQFLLDGQAFKVTDVYQQTLGEMGDEDAQAEGFVSLDEYKAFILGMHPGMPWLPKARVWVHEFVMSGMGDRRDLGHG